MNPKEHGNLRIEWCGPPHMKADDSVAAYLRERGYLVIAPSDTSPVAELVRAACDYDGFPWSSPKVLTRQTVALLNAGLAVHDDPAVRAWVERGRK